jgi:hypothetical protein
MGIEGPKVGSLWRWVDGELECMWSNDIGEDEGPMKMRKGIRQRTLKSDENMGVRECFS